MYICTVLLVCTYTVLHNWNIQADYQTCIFFLGGRCLERWEEKFCRNLVAPPPRPFSGDGGGGGRGYQPVPSGPSMWKGRVFVSIDYCHCSSSWCMFATVHTVLYGTVVLARSLISDHHLGMGMRLSFTAYPFVHCFNKTLVCSATA